MKKISPEEGSADHFGRAIQWCNVSSYLAILWPMVEDAMQVNPISCNTVPFDSAGFMQIHLSLNWLDAMRHNATQFIVGAESNRNYSTWPSNLVPRSTTHRSTTGFRSCRTSSAETCSQSKLGHARKMPVAMALGHFPALPPPLPGELQ